MDLRFASLPSQHADPAAQVAAAGGRMLFGPGASPLTLIHPVETPTDGELMSDLAQGHGEVLETLIGAPWRRNLFLPAAPDRLP